MKQPIILTGLAVLLIATPILFTWHAELYMEMLLHRPNAIFTNGLWSTNAVVVYHAFLYLLFATNITAAGVLIHHKRKTHAEE